MIETKNELTELQEELESIGHLKIAKFTELLEGPDKNGPHKNTVDGWFKQLEKNNIHFVSRIGKEKVYTAIDYQIALYIEKRRKEGWVMKGIFDSLESGETGLELRKSELVEEEISINKNQLMQLMKRMNDMENIARQAAKNEIENHQKLLLEDKETARLNRFNDLIGQRRVLDNLRKKAIEEWEKKPEDVRFTKVGFLMKKLVENTSMKNDFIEDFISTHYESELKSEFGIDE